jgi:cysteine synthase
MSDFGRDSHWNDGPNLFTMHGTISGVGRFLKAHCPDVLLVLADPIGSRLAHLVDQRHPDHDAGYQVEGIGGSVMPSECDPGVINSAERVSDRSMRFGSHNPGLLPH